ncbi:amino acid permease [Swaminathania salitolerans]|uniref:Amino acid permease n=1 Tax=Swaminathania salitolerans TaxID=182838 RepID=A0A511BSN1_9PROT|nr:amino acid permease [Swaminathania salitolerans]GBQ13137.1 amino acid permease [Swaminathania salitolerans LMG 21291]GEL03346.1 amino acid permease [Swaminathania salitolerans]
MIADDIRVKTRHPAGRQKVASTSLKDEERLALFGYQQELRRDLGPFASFAAGFSFVSVLTTVFEMFPLGYGFGGPVFFWTWPLVFFGQFCVALCFAELAARFPVAGAIYQWSTRLASPGIGWMAGWLTLIGYIVSVSAIAIAMQSILPSLWDGFQLVGGSADITTLTGAENAIILGTLTILTSTLISCIGVRISAFVTVAGVYAEMLGLCLLIAALFMNIRRGFSVTMDMTHLSPGMTPHGAFLASMLMAVYVMYGFDSAAELSEETRRPDLVAPKAIVRCLLLSFVAGGLVILGTLMAAPSLGSGELATIGIPYVIHAITSGVTGHILLATVAISVFSATIAIQTSASRVLFSMSRDGVIPGCRRLGGISSRTGTPITATIVVGILSIGFLWVNFGDASLFSAITASAVTVTYLAYLMVTLPLLVRRVQWLRGGSPSYGFRVKGRTWRAGVNIVAVVSGAAFFINTLWPRMAVFDPSGERPGMVAFPVVFLGAALGLGLILRKIRSARRDHFSHKEL